jgi:DNA replication protein
MSESSNKPIFSGFSAGKVHLTPIPGPFFTQLLPVIKSLAELKVVLYAFWFLDHLEGMGKYFTYFDFCEDKVFLEGLGTDPEKLLQESMDQATDHGIFLRVGMEKDKEDSELIYFLNTPRGRAAARALQQGNWKPGTEQHLPVTFEMERPNIFRLYEENIGPLTPILSEMLREAELNYPTDWIEDALRIAIKKNVRNWRYIEAVLKSWQEKGRHEETRSDSEKDRRKYIEGEYGDLIEH